MDNDIVDPNTVKDDPFMFGIFDSVTGILLFVIICILLLLLMYIIIRRVSHRISVNQEKRSLKDDLMIWSRLSSLISGGKRTVKGKKQLADNHALIKLIFETALNVIKIKCFRRYNTPWYLCVGEPFSGKTSLLKVSSLDCERVRKDVDLKDEEPLHFCVNRESVYLDIRGRVFFDNWIGDSSAEWSSICELIAKFHHVKPLSGIILTIPADALIADDPTLTERKAALIFSELMNLKMRIRMDLSCRIVITKSDCIVGFRDYFQALPLTSRVHSLGFTLSDDKNGFFSQETFSSAFDGFIGNIRRTALGSFLSKKVVDSSYTKEGRASYSTYIYSFANNLNSLKSNLESYLSKIFGPGNSVIPGRLEGIYFCSSKDAGVCLNGSYAAYTSSKVDENLLTTPHQAVSPLFVTDTIGTTISKLDKKSDFTSGEKRRRNIPSVALGLLLGILSVNYLFGTFASRSLIYYPLGDDAEYYQVLTRLFDSNVIQNAPLFGVNENSSQGEILFDQRITDESDISRINFFDDTRSRLLSDVPLPFIYSPTAQLFYERNNVRAKTRRSIYNQLLADMIFIPAARAFSYNLVNDKNPFSEAKADAFFSFIKLSEYKDNIGGKQVYPSTEVMTDTLKLILQSIYPTLTKNVMENLSYIADGDPYYDVGTVREILSARDYNASIHAGMRMFLRQMMDLSAYPEADYQHVKRYLTVGARLNQNYRELEKFSLNSDEKISFNEILQMHKHYESLVKENIALSNELDSSKNDFLNLFSRVNIPAGGKEKAEKVNALNLYRQGLLIKAYEVYKGILSEDFDVFSNYIRTNSFLSSDIGVSEMDVHDAKLRSLRNLEADYKNLSSFIEKSNIFDMVPVKDKQEEYKYRILASLIKMCDFSKNEIPLDITDLAQYESYFNLIRGSYKERRDLLAAEVKLYKDDQSIAQVAAGISKYLEFSELFSLMQLTENMIALYPHDKSIPQNVNEIANLVAKSGETDDEEYDRITALADSSLGRIGVNPGYFPVAVKRFINPVGFISNYGAKEEDGDKKDSKGNAEAAPKVDAFKVYLDNSKEIEIVKKSCMSYADAFINYWASFADEVKPYYTDYHSFHGFAAISKAYEINSQLLDLYNLSYEVLTKVNLSGLHAKTKSTRDHGLKIIDSRRKLLDLNFNQASSNVLNAWALLPSDPVMANRYIRSLDKKTVRNDYTLVLSKADASGNIPWWSAFVKLGTSLLKSEANFSVVTGLEKFQNRLFYFPILRDGAENGQVIQPEDMLPLRKQLRSYGIINPPKKKDAAEDDANEKDESILARDEGVDNMQEPLLSGVVSERSDVSTWANKIDRLLTDLGDLKKPLIAKISIPPLKVQDSIIKKKYGNKFKNSSITFRYVEVTAGNESPERYGCVVEKEEKIIYQNPVKESDLKLNFFRYSEDATPETSVVYAGAYAPLRLYLDENIVHLDEDKDHASYVPVELTSKDGEVSIFIIKVYFNKQLLLPEEWPSSENWPLISSF